MENGRIPDLIAELEWRGLLKDVTDREGLRAHLADPVGSPRRIYAGLDPTADSLTIGNLVTIMALAHAKRAGHEAVVVMGGGTGLIGDPSGKSEERGLKTREEIKANLEGQRPIYERVLGPINGPPHRLVNNLDWLDKWSYLDLLRDIGKHFSVNEMIKKESVRARLEEREQGITYTEFSYMILQAYDFLHLSKPLNEGGLGVTVQFGGSDQYGNIVAGLELIRRVKHESGGASVARMLAEDPAFGGKGEEERQGYLDEASRRDQLEARLPKTTPGMHFGLTWPLVTKSDGGKFGKTESGAVWLTADRTSPYAYYQFWLNATDVDAVNWLKVFTFLPQDEIAAIVAEHGAEPGKRLAQRTLAEHATTILHGKDAAERAEAAAKALFSGEIAALDEATLREVFADVPSSEHSLERLAAGRDPLDLLVETGLASSRSEGRRFLAEGSVSINGRKITPLQRIDRSDLLHGSMIAIRRGKKAWHLTRWV
jgi:tyrosyl-tRNA synthetase